MSINRFYYASMYASSPAAGCLDQQQSEIILDFDGWHIVHGKEICGIFIKWKVHV